MAVIVRFSLTLVSGILSVSISSIYFVSQRFCFHHIESEDIVERDCNIHIIVVKFEPLQWEMCGGPLAPTAVIKNCYLACYHTRTVGW